MPRQWRWVRWVVGLVIGLGIVRSLTENWAAIITADVSLAPNVALLSTSLLPVWIAYALLIEAWRQVVHAWDQPPVSYRQAGRIWMLSNLGRYIPGKIWTITGMAMLARECGIAPWAATTSAIVLQIIAIASGAIIVATAGAFGLQLPGLPWVNVGGLLLIAALGLWAVTSGPATAWITQRFNPGAPPTAPSASLLLSALGVNALAWAAYGLSLWLVTRGLFSGPYPPLLDLIGAWAASYLAGFLSPLPGGIGIREGVLFALLRNGPLGPGGALALAGASRISMTIAELAATVVVTRLRQPEGHSDES